MRVGKLGSANPTAQADACRRHLAAVPLDGIHNVSYEVQQDTHLVEGVYHGSDAWTLLLID